MFNPLAVPCRPSKATLSVPLEPLLPFLYTTKTIRRCFSERQALGRRSSPELMGTTRNPLNVNLDGTKSARAYSTHDSRIDERWRVSERKEHQERSIRPERQGGERTRHNGRHTARNNDVWVEHVPFEKADQEFEATEGRLEGSTITSGERKAFEQLLRMRKDSDDAAGEQGEGKSGREGLDDILEAAAKNVKEQTEVKKLPAALLPMAKKAQRHLKIQQNEAKAWVGPHSTSYRVREAGLADLERVQKHFDQAQTDIEMWESLHRHVLSRVMALELDPITNAWQKSVKAKYKRPKDIISTGKAELTDASGQLVITDRDILTETLPRHIINFHRTLRTSFPSSSLARNLLPYLKQLGPTAFALAASTSLYNVHLNSLFKKHLDLDAVCNLVEEMDKQVYDFDERTHSLLAQILVRSDRARKRVESDSMEAIWGSQYMQDSIQRVYWLTKKVERRLQEQALREANEGAATA